jgi:hypothetical protein
MAHHGICSVPNCRNTLIVAHGLCDAHYRRQRKHGTPTGGRTPQGETHAFFRDVVMVYDGNECLIWPYNRNGTGYGQMSRLGAGSGKKDLVHRKVCEMVNGPAPSPEHQAAHSCGNGRGGCCAKRHVSWKTAGGNTADKFLHGTIPRGEKVHNAIMTEAEVIRAREMIASGMMQKEIAAEMGVSKQTINHIRMGNTWSWLD